MFSRQLAPLLMLLSVAVHAADDAAVQLKQLDDKVQSLKSRVLELNTDIDRIEQQIYPLHARLQLFLSLHRGVVATLVSASVRIDDELVASHLYTEAENRALGNGGIQQLHGGALVSGEHRLQLSVGVQRAQGVEQLVLEHVFDKQEAPVSIEVVLVPGTDERPKLEIRSP